MLSDIGYTWTRIRAWTTSTVSHNTVIVDRQEQTGRPSDGDLLWFFPDSNGVSVVEADGKRAYGNIKGLDLYRRMLMVIPVSDADAYVVDIFRVRGGSMHDWMLHGDADEDTTATCSLALTEKLDNLLEPGEKWVEPQLSGDRTLPYGVLRDMRSAQTSEGFIVSFSYASDPPKGVHVHVLGGAATQVLLGKSPSVRRTGVGTAGDNRKVFDYWMPHLVARRRGPAPLASVFVVVYEPYSGKPFLASVSSLKLTPEASAGVAVQIRHGDAVDTLLGTLDDSPVTADGLHVKGRLGIVRRQSGKVVGAWLFEGQSLSGDGFSLKAERDRYTGEIVAATRKADGQPQDAFLTSAELPTGDQLHGSWMIVTHGNGFRHGYQIERIERQDGKTVIVLTDDHGLKIDGAVTHEFYFPQRKIEGKNTFVIPLATTMVRSS
jgi:hypothetical protein